MLSGYRPYIPIPWGADLLYDINQSEMNKVFTCYALKRAELVTTYGAPFAKQLDFLGLARPRYCFIPSARM